MSDDEWWWYDVVPADDVSLRVVGFLGGDEVELRLPASVVRSLTEHTIPPGSFSVVPTPPALCVRRGDVDTPRVRIRPGAYDGPVPGPPAPEVGAYPREVAVPRAIRRLIGWRE